jgi:hypothetical protein
MTHSQRALDRFFLVCFFVSLFGSTGCATSSDMEHFKQTVNQRLDVLASSLQADSRRIQAQLDSQAKRQQELSRAVETMKSTVEGEVHAIRSEVGELKADTKTTFEELVASETARAQLMKDLRLESAHIKKTLDAVAQEGSKEIRSLQQALAVIPSLVTSVGTELHSLSQTLLGGYRLEEAALRERLRSVEQVLKQLEPTALHTSQAAGQMAHQPGAKAAVQAAGQIAPNRP